MKPCIEPTAAIVQYVTQNPGVTSQQIASALLSQDYPYELRPAISSIKLIFKVNALCANKFLRGETGRDRKHRFYPIVS